MGHSIIQLENRFERDFLEKNNVDFGISYRYRHIIKKNEIDWFNGRLVNLHISLLPFGRGQDPNIWSYLEDAPTGVTIHQIDEGLDTGPILIQKKVAMDIVNDTLSSSYRKLSNEIESLFISSCESILSLTLEAKAQVPDTGSFHVSKDKAKYAHLWEKDGWNTPIAELMGKALALG